MANKVAAELRVDGQSFLQKSNARLTVRFFLFLFFLSHGTQRCAGGVGTAAIRSYVLFQVCLMLTCSSVISSACLPPCLVGLSPRSPLSKT